MPDEPFAEKLATMGVSETEAEAYLTVLKHGEATVTTIADETDLSRGYVYQIVESLADEGFVGLNDRVTPTKVRANPPEDVIGSLVADLEEITPALEERWATAGSEPHGIEVHKSRPTVVDRLEAIINDAEGELLLSIPTALFSEVKDRVRAAFERGVMVLLYLWRANPDELTEDEFDGIATIVRAWPHWSPMMVTIDFNRTGLLPPEHVLFQSDTELRAIEAHDQMPVYVMRSALLAQEWPSARQVYTRDPVELPWESDWFSTITLNATLHRQAGTELRAQVEAREIERETMDAVVNARRDGPFETIEAPVVDVRQRILDPIDRDPFENCLVLDHDGREVTVGGSGAFLEDYEARSVRLLADE